MSMRCPGVGAAARNLTLPQVPCGYSSMLSSHLQFSGGLLVEASNLRAWITHGPAPGGDGRTGEVIPPSTGRSSIRAGHRGMGWLVRERG